MKLAEFIKRVRAERNGGDGGSVIKAVAEVIKKITRKDVNKMSSTEYSRRFYGEPGFRAEVDKLFAGDR